MSTAIALRSWPRASCWSRSWLAPPALSPPRRAFHLSLQPREQNNSTPGPGSPAPSQPQRPRATGLGELGSKISAKTSKAGNEPILGYMQTLTANKPAPRASVVHVTRGGQPPAGTALGDLSLERELLPANQINPAMQPPHHLHIYSTKHNTHITLTKPNRDALISVSAGNIGMRKSSRGSYDAASQLANYVMNRIQDTGLLMQIAKLEIVMRGFGQGRIAVTKALLGTEGRLIKPKIVRLTDATKLKFGGTRGRKRRRLG